MQFCYEISDVHHYPKIKNKNIKIMNFFQCMAFCLLGMKVQYATGGTGMLLGDSTHTVTLTNPHSYCYSLSVTQWCAVTVTMRMPVYYKCYLAVKCYSTPQS